MRSSRRWGNLDVISLRAGDDLRNDLRRRRASEDRRDACCSWLPYFLYEGFKVACGANGHEHAADAGPGVLEGVEASLGNVDTCSRSGTDGLTVHMKDERALQNAKALLLSEVTMGGRSRVARLGYVFEEGIGITLGAPQLPRDQLATRHNVRWTMACPQSSRRLGYGTT